MERITSTDKWKDVWFLNLSPYGKLMFMFLCDNCDDAGFYTLSARFMSNQLRISPKDVVSSTRALNDKICFSNDRKKVWIKNFLFYQKQLPLESNNQDHKKIKLMLEKNLKSFNEDEEMLFIIESTETVSGKKKTPRKKFEKPTLKEMKEYGEEYSKKEKVIMQENWADQLYNHYESNGWKIGGKSPMKDWKGAVRNAVLRVKGKPTEGKGKIAKIKDANKGATDIVVEG
jgi:hypothetical protein